LGQSIFCLRSQFKHPSSKLRTAHCRHTSDDTSTPLSTPPKLKDNIYTIPNALSLSRILISPVTAYTVISGQHTLALALFGIAGITDFLDGQIARRFPSQRSLLGSIIDPIGDKTLMGCTTFAVWYSGLMPGWLVCIILGRDIILLSGAAVAKYKTLDKFSLRRMFSFTDATLEVKPGWHGKLNMCLQLGAVLGCLAAPIWSFQGHVYLDTYLVMTGVMGVYSLVQYIITYKKVIGTIDKPPEWMDKK
jgi:cardiolipin synthase